MDILIVLPEMRYAKIKSYPNSIIQSLIIWMSNAIGMTSLYELFGICHLIELKA